MEGYKKSKITLNMLKGKPMNASVPSFRFNATAEEIEELYATDEEHDDIAADNSAPRAASDAEGGSGSPSRTSRLGKRSVSVDVSSVDLSPPTDPWRFFTDIKGKIAKSVEGKITEYKTRSSEGDSTSPKRCAKGGSREARECKDQPKHSRDGKEKSSSSKAAKEGKEPPPPSPAGAAAAVTAAAAAASAARDRENSSLSESEEVSESSISRTCGIASTTEGVEMSSDDEVNTSLSDKREEKECCALSTGALTKSSFKQTGADKMKRNVTIVTRDGRKETKTTTAGFLEELQNINMGIEVDQMDVESGVDVLAQIHNIEVDGSDISITQMTGEDIRKRYYEANQTDEATVFAPSGYVDMRPPLAEETTWEYLFRNRFYCYAIIALIFYILLPISTYMSGFIAGNLLMFGVGYVYLKANELATPYNMEMPRVRKTSLAKEADFVEVPAAKEERPTLKYQGWVNEYPEAYDPYTYHISQTQSVYLRLQGNLLKISNTKSKIPKRASYNEAEHKMMFTRHRIYNLLAAEVVLLPLGLTKIRHWSKKYPICIILNKDQLCYDQQDKKQTPDTDPSMEMPSSKGGSSAALETLTATSSTQVYSKLIEESANENASDGTADETTTTMPSTKAADDGDDSPPFIGATATTSADDLNDDELIEEEMSFFDTAETIDPAMDMAFLHDPIEQTCIYIFARTDREKEHWYRRFKRATHRLGTSGSHLGCCEDSASDIVRDDTHYYAKYLKIMAPILTPIESGGTYSMFMTQYASTAAATASPLRTSDSSLRGRRSRASIETDDYCNDAAPCVDMQWLNTMLFRMVFDFHQSEHVTRLIQERVAKKLAAIKLPIFIESLRMTELTFGNYAPKVCKIGRPYLDEWGLWMDFDLSYEGSVVVMVLTKLNLLKLKQQGERNGGESSSSTAAATVTVSASASASVHTAKSAIYNSDIEDTAESSSDDEGRARGSFAPPPLDDAGHPMPGLGGVSKQNKKFMNMVDRFAESKFFQRAAENKYIKKAIEGVSNTDVGLKLELKALKGCLVINVPPPPSDRIWFGFRAAPMPKLQLTAHPIVGERNWNFNKVSNWIEKRVYKEFLKVLLLPNMEDVLVPGMDPRLPE